MLRRLPFGSPRLSFPCMAGSLSFLAVCPEAWEGSRREVKPRGTGLGMASSTLKMSDYKGLLKGRQRGQRRGHPGPWGRGGGPGWRVGACSPTPHFQSPHLRGRPQGATEATALRGQGGPGVLISQPAFLNGGVGGGERRDRHLGRRTLHGRSASLHRTGQCVGWGLEG